MLTYKFSWGQTAFKAKPIYRNTFESIRIRFFISKQMKLLTTMYSRCLIRPQPSVSSPVCYFLLCVQIYSTHWSMDDICGATKVTASLCIACVVLVLYIHFWRTPALYSIANIEFLQPYRGAYNALTWPVYINAHKLMNFYMYSYLYIFYTFSGFGLVKALCVIHYLYILVRIRTGAIILKFIQTAHRT